MAAVAPQPVIVDYPAGAPTSGSPIFLAANSEVWFLRRRVSIGNQRLPDWVEPLGFSS